MPVIRRPEVVPPVPDRGFLVPMLSGRQKLALLVFFVLWAVVVARFFRWWFVAGLVAQPVGFVFSTCVIGFTMLLPLWLFFTASRARVPSKNHRASIGRVALVVTKAPSEPWPMLQTTLRAMQAQDYDGRFDVWLADEAPTDEVRQWCYANEVFISTRFSIAEYHNTSWPRRTRSKEGNLAYFYDTFGYKLYDVVCQFDADHRPRTDYVTAVARAFADPEVGYVAAPSICSTNAADSWTARGRLHREASLHGLVQAGHNEGYGPTCIGSHYAVRTRALREIGGVGPELAEDFSTSFLMASHGWKGVFAIDAIAEGEGPSTFMDGMTQELQWSRSLTSFALLYTPGRWQRMSRTERFRFGFAQVWYPLFVTHLAVGTLIAPTAALLNQPWVDVSLIDYFSRAALPTIVIVAMMSWFRRYGWLRPSDAPVISWESALFTLTRWPWNLLGIAQAAIGAVRGKQYDFKVTPKASASGAGQELALPAIAPYLAISAALACVTIIGRGHVGALGYVGLTAIASVVYSAVAAAVLVLHRRENETSPTDQSWKTLAAVVSSAALAAASVVSTITGVSVGWERRDLAAELVGVDSLATRSSVFVAVALAATLGWVLFQRKAGAPSFDSRTSPPAGLGTSATVELAARWGIGVDGGGPFEEGVRDADLVA